MWIYGSYSDWDSKNTDSNDYCHPTLYMFAFWLTTSTYIIMLLSCMCCACVGCVVGLSGARDGD